MSMVIASPTLYTPSLYLSLVPYFLRNKLTLLHLPSRLSSSQLYSLFQITLSLLTLTSVIFIIVLEPHGDEVHVEEFLFPLVWVRAEVFVVCHCLAKARGDAFQDDINQMLDCHLGIYIASIYIVQVFLDSTCLFEIIDPVNSPACIVMVTIVLSNGILDFFTSIKPILVRIPAFQRISFCA